MLALPEKDTADMLFGNPSPRSIVSQAHLILLLVIASPLNLCLTLRLYASLASYLRNAPYPIVIRYNTAQRLLMMRPVGKPSSLVPRTINSSMPVVLADCELWDPVLAKTPKRKDASWHDSWVLIEVPSCCVPESVIDGVRSDSAVVLCMAVSKCSMQH